MIFRQKNSPLLHPGKYTVNVTALSFSRNNIEGVKNNVTERPFYQKKGFFDIKKSGKASYICDYQQSKGILLFGQKGHKDHASLLRITTPVLTFAQLLVSESIARVTENKNYNFNNHKIYNSTKSPNNKSPNIQSPFSMAVSPLVRKKIKRKIKGVLGKIYISSTKNNTIITLADNKNNTKGWSCSGSMGFKNARKSTTYAAQAAAENIVDKARVLGYTHLRLLVKGLGRGKQSCLRALSKSGLKIISIEDKTGIPYNGCRLSKKRRV